MKAYYIQGDDYGTIVFNKHSVAARRIGANELDAGFGNVTCTRMKELDKYAQQGYVPPKILIENHDWWFECFYCGAHVSAEYDNLSDIVYVGNRVFCDNKCLSAFEIEKKEINKEFEDFKKTCKKQFSELIFTKFRGGYPIRTPSAEFKFPGSKYKNKIMLCTDKKLYVYIANGDMDAWKKFKENNFTKQK